MQTTNGAMHHEGEKLTGMIKALETSFKFLFSNNVRRSYSKLIQCTVLSDETSCEYWTSLVEIYNSNFLFQPPLKFYPHNCK